jgi:hypothetical protein
LYVYTSLFRTILTTRRYVLVLTDVFRLMYDLKALSISYMNYTYIPLIAPFEQNERETS